MQLGRWAGQARILWSYREIITRGAKPCRLLKSWNLLLTFFSSRSMRIAHILYQVGLSRSGANNSLTAREIDFAGREGPQYSLYRAGLGLATTVI